MVNRAQVILIVTGIGARPIEEVLPGAETLNQRVATSIGVQPSPTPVKIIESNPVRSVAGPEAAPVADPLVDNMAAWQVISKPEGGFESDALLNAENLDIPAFLRRRRSFVPKKEPFPNQA
jgi:hypothetical protein